MKYTTEPLSREMTETKFREFLEPRWLRPETAIMSFLKSQSFQIIEFNSPSLDICCGDGCLMFQHFGGEFDFSYDIFQGSRARDFKHDKFIDIFDSPDSVEPIIRRNVPWSVVDKKIDVGLDWKQNLLTKAEYHGV